VKRSATYFYFSQPIAMTSSLSESVTLQVQSANNYLPSSPSVYQTQHQVEAKTTSQSTLISSELASPFISSPWQVLRYALGFANEDQRYWWDKSGKF